MDNLTGRLESHLDVIEKDAMTASNNIRNKVDKYLNRRIKKLRKIIPNIKTNNLKQNFSKVLDLFDEIQKVVDKMDELENCVEKEILVDSVKCLEE